MENPQQLLPTDIIIKFYPKEDCYTPVVFSYEGGVKHKYHNLHNDPSVIVQHIVNRYIVDRILPKPTLKRDEYLCNICRTKARIGIMKPNRYEDGTESQAVVELHGDCEYSFDRSFYVRYLIHKCDRCGNEDIDYG